MDYLNEVLLTITRALPAGVIPATRDPQEVSRSVAFVCEVASLLFNNVQVHSGGLTHWGRDKMADISQMTFSNAFYWIKMYEVL